MKTKYPKLLTIILCISFSIPVRAQIFPKDTLLFNGDINKLINLVILPDGYNGGEMTKFRRDADSLISKIFVQQPFREYKNYFNIITIRVPSTTSGINHPKTAADCNGVPSIGGKNPYFGCAFDYNGIHRLVWPTNSNAYTVLANNFPSYDQIFIMANSPYYGGGGGGGISVATSDASSAEVAVHEFGHAFPGLMDEYSGSWIWEAPNCTQEENPSLNKWKNWLGSSGIGIYAYAAGYDWYKPSQSCKMQYLGQPFCHVCVDAFVETIHDLTNPIYSYLPAATTLNIGDTVLKFSTTLLKPIPNTLRRTWYLNGNIKAINQDSLSVSTVGLTNNSTVKLTVLDTTKLTKKNTHGTTHMYTVIWTLKRTLTAIKINSFVEDNVFTIYPNPSNEKLNISYELQKPSDLVFDIIDISGKEIIIGKKRSVNAGKGIESIDISNLATGEYFIRVLKDSAPLSLPFIKM